jgi:hypothetical protein
MSPQESRFRVLLSARPLSLIASLILVLVSITANAQTVVPSWVGNLILENSTINADPTLTAPEAQGLGPKFELLFAMANAQDPQNSDNNVITLNTGPSLMKSSVIGVAVRNMVPGAKIETLTNQISLKYLLVGRTCSGGSPRIQLFIDPGDGTSRHNAFGYVGHGSFGTGCITGMWDTVDMANLTGNFADPVPVPRWDLSQWFSHGVPACDMTCTWPQVVAFFDTTFPNHVVLSGGVFDDSCSFDPASCGTAFYDLVTVENRTLENKQDTVQGPTQ